MIHTLVSYLSNKKKETNMNFKSLNEAIESVTNPQPELTQEEYIDILESTIKAIAEELGCSVEDLMEDIQTPEREKVMKNRGARLQKAARPIIKKDSTFFPSTEKLNKHKFTTAKEKGSPHLYGAGGKIKKRWAAKSTNKWSENERTGQHGQN